MVCEAQCPTDDDGCVTLCVTQYSACTADARAVEDDCDDDYQTILDGWMTQCLGSKNDDEAYALTTPDCPSGS